MAQTTIVSTKLGKVKGKIVELYDGSKVKVFRRLPFAKPPIGERRFMPPEPSEPWSGILDGTTLGNLPVYQNAMEDGMNKTFPISEDEEITKVYDEDSLHLSVYVPEKRTDKKLAVMMWIYGGGFQMGSERTYDASVIAGMNDVIVVVPNYRVGIFGFLSFGKNSLCPGNAGLLDQQEALKWVQNNIQEFGGDRDNVTIFGESAGGASVHLQILSPLAKGLFHKAISHSGQHQLVEQLQGEDYGIKGKNSVVKHFKIEFDNDRDILKALQNIPAEKLLEASGTLMVDKLYFMPCVDGKVLPKATGELIKDHAFAKVPYIIGCNNTEGDGILSMFTPEVDFAKGITEEQAFESVMLPPVTDKGRQLMKERYLKNEDKEVKFSKFLGRLIGDGSFVAPAVESAVAHSETGADVYCYLGTFRLKMHHDDGYGDVTRKVDWCECDHGDDIMITFGAPFAPDRLLFNAKFSEEEKRMSKEFMTYLTNFAKNGDPNVGVKVPLRWPKYKAGGTHLVVNRPMSTKSNFGVDVAKFWNEQLAPHFEQR